MNNQSWMNIELSTNFSYLNSFNTSMWSYEYQINERNEKIILVVYRYSILFQHRHSVLCKHHLFFNCYDVLKFSSTSNIVTINEVVVIHSLSEKREQKRIKLSNFTRTSPQIERQLSNHVYNRSNVQHL